MQSHNTTKQGLDEKPASDLRIENSMIEEETTETYVESNSRTIKQLKLKADLILLPLLSISFLLNSLDRSNVSNAHTAGLTKDLGLVNNQFNQVLTYYLIPLVTLGPFMTMATKRFGASWTLPIMLLALGASSLATGFAKDFKDLVICRVFVGVFEAGFLSSVIYYLSIWYTKKELATRIGIFYAALVASSAFGGLLAYGIFQIKGGSYFVWSYLFFLEGGLTMLWATVLFFGLPAGPRTAWFLTAEQKETAYWRTFQDPHVSEETAFSLKEARAEFRTPHGYIRVVLGLVAGTVLSSNATFLAIIVKLLGFGAVKTNLYTVAPALTGAVFLVAFSMSSDRFRNRGLHIALAAVFSLVGFVLLGTISIHNIPILYLAIFLCTIGAYPASPVGSAWVVTNTPNLNARALTTAMFITAGNCGAFVSSNIYLDTEAPRYPTAVRTNIGLSVLLIVLSSCYTVWMKWENKRRQAFLDTDAGRDWSDSMETPILNSNDRRFIFDP